MINLYKFANEVILKNPFSTPYKCVPYNALFYHAMTLNLFTAKVFGGNGLYPHNFLVMSSFWDFQLPHVSDTFNAIAFV